MCWYKTIDTNSFTGEDLCYRRFLNCEHNLSHTPTECPDNSCSKCAIIVSLWTWQTICVMVYSHRGCRYNINITEDATLHQHHPVGCSSPHRHTVHGECAVSANDNDWGFGSWTLCLRIYDFPIYLLPRVLRNSEQLFPRQKLHVQKVYSLGYGRGGICSWLATIRSIEPKMRWIVHEPPLLFDNLHHEPLVALTRIWGGIAYCG